MEKPERERIENAVDSNSELKRLYNLHAKLETKLSRFQGMTFLTAREEMEIKNLKKKKLQGKERIMKILSTTPELHAS